MGVGRDSLTARGAEGGGESTNIKSARGDERQTTLLDSLADTGSSYHREGYEPKGKEASTAREKHGNFDSENISFWGVHPRPPS